MIKINEGFGIWSINNINCFFAGIVGSRRSLLIRQEILTSCGGLYCLGFIANEISKEKLCPMANDMQLIDIFINGKRVRLDTGIFF